MAFSKEKFYRSNDGMVAGICQGLSQHMGIDVAVLRFAVVALSLVSLGFFALVYIALWLLLPSQSASVVTLDISPDSVDSYTYGSMGEREHQRKKAAKAMRAHTPPSPPLEDEDFAIYQQASGPSALIGLCFAILASVTVFSLFVSNFMLHISLYQFWPLLLVCFGMMRIVIPGEAGYRMDAFALGVVILSAGVMLFLQVTGFIYLNVASWFVQGWPILLICAGLLVLWRASHLNGFAIASLIALIAFCLVGIAFCSVPGPSYLYGASQIIFDPLKVAVNL